MKTTKKNQKKNTLTSAPAHTETKRVAPTDRDIIEAATVKVGLKTLDVDTNHPLAGKTVTFAVEVVEVRDAMPEEIQHGHAHGVGGHQH